ncbi:MAG: hypothetical protein H6682_04500 [Candidatus Eisenbacteria bacterium]|nr:hypothetical protein [Candidatus Eisenbacteria bacterium]
MRGEFPSNGPFGAGGERRPIAAFHFASALSTAFGALPATSTTLRIVRSISLFAFAMPFAIFFALATPTPSDAEWTPSAELHFRAEIVPDTLTVGDPIALILEGSAPAGGDLLVPSFADSVGPFTLLGAEDLPVAKEGRKEGEDELRVSFSRRLRMTAFDTGRVGLAPIPLLWVSSEGDTSVAYSDSLFAEVVSVLPDSVLAKIGAGDQQAALAQIRDAKGPEELVPSRLWLWILLGAVAVALLTWAALRYLRRKPAAVALPAAKPAAPKLPPELAFRKGLDALVAQKFVEKGSSRSTTPSSRSSSDATSKVGSESRPWKRRSGRSSKRPAQIGGGTPPMSIGCVPGFGTRTS